MPALNLQNSGEQSRVEMLLLFGDSFTYIGLQTMRHLSKANHAQSHRPTTPRVLKRDISPEHVISETQGGDLNSMFDFQPLLSPA
jgi:hypothetical protein